MKSFLERIFSSIQRKMLLYIAVPLLLFIVVAMGLAFRVLNRDAAALVESSAREQARQTAVNIDVKLRDLGRFAELTAAFVEASPDVNENELYALTRGNAAVEPLIYGSAIAYVPNAFSADRALFAPYSFKRGAAIADLDIGNLGAGSGYDYTSGEWEWWEAPLAAGRAVWTQPYYDEGAGNVVMATYSVPFRAGGAIQGVATIDIYLAEIFAGIGLTAANEFIVDHAGRIIFSHDSSRILAANLRDLDLGLAPGEVDRLLQEADVAPDGNVHLVNGTDGAAHWGLFGHVPRTGWIYLNLVPERSALQFIDNQRRIMSLTIGAIMLILVLMVWFISGRMAAPIETLHAAVQRVSDGDYAVEFKVGSGDEIGRLAANLHTLTGVIARKNEDWEAQVHARTAALTRSEQALSRQKEMLERALNGIDIGIIMYDSGLRILAQNDKLSEVVRFDRTLVADKDFLEQARRFYRDRVKQPFDEESYLKGALSPNRSTRLVRYDPDLCIEIKHCPLGEGVFIRTFEDVSVREQQSAALQQKLGEVADSQRATLNMMKDAEEARQRIHESQQMMEIIFNTSGNFIYAKDLEGKYLVANDYFLQHTGLSREQIIGHDDIEVFGEKDGRAYMENDRQVIASRTFQRLDEAVGTRKNISYKYPLTDLNGTVTGVCGISTDITEQKEMQEALTHAKQEAEAATAAKANFLASMSHEIRTPMNAVIGMGDLLRQTELDEEQREMLRTISFSGQALLTIINDILDLSKIESGKMALEKIPFSLLETVEGSAKTVSINAQKKGLALLTAVDPAIPAMLQGDPVRLRQILINLIGNAIKFTEKGKIVVRVRPAGSENGQMRIRLEVQDEGIGIAPEVQRNLFSDFMQAEASTTRKYGGTGLGLSICKRLATMMGGTIGVESELGKGATFFAELPFDGVAGQEAQTALADLSGLHLLLVSNDAEVMTLIQPVLQSRGAVVSVSHSLDACLDACDDLARRGKPVDCVILGYDWTRGDEFGVATRARQRGNRTTRFIAMVVGRRLKARIDSEDTLTLDVVPLTGSGIVHAVAIAAGRASPDVHHGDTELIEKPARLLSVDEARAAGTLVLVAEDNPTNRDVIGRQLRVLGHTFEMAEDGKQALELWRRGQYAVLLTDCHMPVMDGFELTAAIRDDEAAGQGAQRFPIVAITANALQGEAERCLAAGMDAYMSKPIDMKELRKMLKRFVPEMHTAESAPQPLPAAAKADASPVNPAVLKGMFGDDMDTFREILREFVAPSRQIADEIHAAASAGSAKALKQAAHKLKSSARSIGANQLADLCLALEQAGAESALDSVSVTLKQFDDSIAAVFRYIESLG